MSLANYLTETMFGIVVVVFVIVLFTICIYLYKTNKQLRELDTISKNLGFLDKESNDNDSYLFEINDKIVQYLKAKDKMHDKLSTIENELNTIKIKNNKQDDDIHDLNNKYDNITTIYSKQLDAISQLGVEEIYRISSSSTNTQDMRLYENNINNMLKMFVKNYAEYMNTETFTIAELLDVYSSELSYIFAKSLYDYELYNYDESIDMLLYKDAFKKYLENKDNIDFILKTYFTKLFNYIDQNEDTIVDKLHSNENVIDIATLKNKLDMQDESFDEKQEHVLFNNIPSIYFRCLYLTKNRHLEDLNNNMLLNMLDTCDAMKLFYTTWTTYNTEKTEKNNRFKKLLEKNQIFKELLRERIKTYNSNLPKMKGIQCDSQTYEMSNIFTSW